MTSQNLRQFEPEIKRGRGLGRRVGGPSQKMFENLYLKSAIWCVFEAKIYLLPLLGSYLSLPVSAQFGPEVSK